MPRPELQPRRWDFLPKHRKVRSQAKWDSGEALARTINEPSQYLADITLAMQQALEMHCIDEGVMFRDHGEVKRFYLKSGRIVGACSGELTEYVYAEWDSGSGGLVHGRPISIRRLREMQVSI